MQKFVGCGTIRHCMHCTVHVYGCMQLPKLVRDREFAVTVACCTLWLLLAMRPLLDLHVYRLACVVVVGGYAYVLRFTNLIGLSSQKED